MRILLVNSNPVVSRLTALSARKESVKLDEIGDVDEFKENKYDIVFVDLESYNSEIEKIIKRLGVKRKVLFYSQDDRDIDDIFNYTILKPFLPSEVSAILREAKIEIDEEENSAPQTKKVEPKEEYLNLNELISTKSDDLAPIELKKGNENREDNLLAELKASEAKIDKLKESFNLDNKITDELPIITREEQKKSLKREQEDIKLFELDDNETKKDELFVLEDTKTKNGLLKFDEESKDEVNFENLLDDKEEIPSKVEKTTSTEKEKSKMEQEIKVERERIEEVTSTPISFTSSSDTSSEIKGEQEESKKEEKIKTEIKYKETPKAVKRVFRDTVGLLPVEELRQLLRGTKIHITIEFPKEV